MTLLIVEGMGPPLVALHVIFLFLVTFWWMGLCTIEALRLAGLAFPAPCWLCWLAGNTKGSCDAGMASGLPCACLPATLEAPAPKETVPSEPALRSPGHLRTGMGQINKVQVVQAAGSPPLPCGTKRR